jgi:hypothetical protein
MEQKTNKPAFLYFLLALLFILAIGGIYGGMMFIADPSGKMLGMDTNHLGASSFKSYLLPGMILFIFNGLFPLFIFYSLLKQPGWKWPETINIYKEQYWQWTFSLYAGIILITWINFQLLIIGWLGAIQPVYGLLGTAIVILTLTPAVKNHYFKRSEYS